MGKLKIVNNLIINYQEMLNSYVRNEKRIRNGIFKMSSIGVLK